MTPPQLGSAIERCINALSDGNDTSEAEGELRALLDCALIVRAWTKESDIAMQNAEIARLILTGSASPDRCVEKHANGLPVLTDAARAALGEQP